MACRYTLNGVPDPLQTSVFQYIEDHGDMARNIFDITMEMSAIENSPIVVGNNGAYFIESLSPKEIMQTVANINNTATKLFGAKSKFMVAAKRGNIFELLVNQRVMKNLTPVNEINEGKSVQGYSENIAREFHLGKEEVEHEAEIHTQGDLARLLQGGRHTLDTLTGYIINNLTKEIQREERAFETTKDEANRIKLEVLRRNLGKAYKREKTISDFYDFADYIVEKADQITDHQEYLSEAYNQNFSELTQDKRFAILNRIMSFQKTINAFHDTQIDKSYIELLASELQKRIESNELEEKDAEGAQDIITALRNSAAVFNEADQNYRIEGIPALVDILMSYAPNNVNQELDARINKIKETGQLSGPNRLDPRVKKLRGFSLKDRFGKPSQELLDINIKQLEEKKITRNSLIRELRVFHEDMGLMGVYTDPAAYSNVASVRLFSKLLQSLDAENNTKAISLIHDLAPELEEFKKAKGIGETDPSKLYEDLYEIVDHPVKTQDGYDTKRIASFVSKVDRNKWYKNKSIGFEALKKEYSFPEKGTPEEREEYFKSSLGKSYLNASSLWWDENTEEVEGAQEKLDALNEEFTAVEQKINSYRQTETPYEVLQGLYVRWGELDFQIKKSFRNGIFIGPLAQPKMSIYSNPKYENMPVESKRYYDILTGVMEEAQENLGSTGMAKNSWDEFSLMVPSVRIGTWDKVIEKGEGVIKEEITDSFLYQGTDTEFGALLDANGDTARRIPQHFTNVLESGVISKDLTNSVLMFADMANRYKAKSKIHGSVLMMDAAMENRQKLTLSSEGNFVVDSSSLNWAGKLKGILKKVHGKDTNAFAHWESYRDGVFYDRQSTADTDVTEGALSTDKAVNNLISFTAYKMLGFNYLQAGNQLVLDSSMNSAEGWAGQYFNRKDLHKARRIVYNPLNLIPAIKEGIVQPLARQNKIFKFMEMVDALQEGEQSFARRTSTSLKKNADLAKLMVLQQMVEHQTTAEKIVAMAINMKDLKDSNGDVIETKNGLWDLLVTLPNGQLVVDPRVVNFNLGDFTSRVLTVVRKTNQMKGKHDITLLQRNPYTRPIQVFRKFMAPGFVKRFGISGGGVAADLDTGGVFEGYYSSSLTLVRNMTMDIAASKNLTTGESQEGRRMLHELFLINLSAFIGGLAMSLLDDADDDDKKYIYFLLYQAKRLQTELTAFKNPNELIRITESPTATVRPIKDIWEFGGSLKDYIAYQTGFPVAEKDVFYQRDTNRNKKGDLKVWKEFLDIIPGYAGASKDPEDQAKYYQMSADE